MPVFSQVNPGANRNEFRVYLYCQTNATGKSIHQEILCYVHEQMCFSHTNCRKTPRIDQTEKFFEIVC